MKKLQSGLLTLLIAIGGCSNLNSKNKTQKAIDFFNPEWSKASSIEYVLEEEKEDYWQTPEETKLKGTGDCEDSSEYLMHLLKKSGKDCDCEKIFGYYSGLGKYFAPQFGHVWVECKFNKKNYVLDPSKKNFERKSKLKGKYIYADPDITQIYVEQKLKEYKKKVSKEKIKDLESLIHRKYGFGQKNSIQNNEYLFTNIKNNGKLVDQVIDGDFMCDLKQEIDALEKTDYNIGYPGCTYGNVQTIDANVGFSRLSPRQLIRIKILLDSLKKPEFRKQIWREVQTDLKDPQVEEGYFASEYGGLIKFYNGDLDVFRVPSTDSIQKKEYIDRLGLSVMVLAIGTNNTYSMIEGVDLEPHVFGYHIHALEEDSKIYAGPSFGISKHGQFSGDIGNALYMIDQRGEEHGLVITKLKGNKFNVGYYGGERKKGQKMEDVRVGVVNLGDWDGE